jgi:hypothetical protein
MRLCDGLPHALAKLSVAAMVMVLSPYYDEFQNQLRPPVGNERISAVSISVAVTIAVPSAPTLISKLGNQALFE